MTALKGAKYWSVLCACFGVQGVHTIKTDHYAEAYRKAVMEKFLLGQGHYRPTWRAVIFCLDRTGEIAVADKIRHIGEPVQGECT